MSIYTRTGDKGSTRLFSGEHIGKDALRVETYGTLDELQAHLGLCRSLIADGQMTQLLRGIEETLVTIAAEVASHRASSKRTSHRIAAGDVQTLESVIDRYSKRYGLPSGFVLPGHSQESAELHVARTICRRCERLLVSLFVQEPGREELKAYINRLSDLLFILAWSLEAEATQPVETKPKSTPPPSLGQHPLEVISPLLTRAAMDHCLQIGVPMVIAIADAEGELLYFSRMQRALPASHTIAPNKAYTAAALRMPTHVVGQLSQPGEELYGVQHTLDGRAVLFGGGYPLELDGQILGAIGISGGSVAQDMEVAEQALQLWRAIIQLAQSLQTSLPGEALLSLCADPQVLRQVCAQIGQPPPKAEELLRGALQLLPGLTPTK